MFQISKINRNFWALIVTSNENHQIIPIYIWSKYFSPASEASREVANLTWRKNPHTPFILLCASPQNHFSKNFKFIPREIQNQNHLKKSLQVWVLEQFSFAIFDLIILKCSTCHGFCNTFLDQLIQQLLRHLVLTIWQEVLLSWGIAINITYY